MPISTEKNKKQLRQHYQRLIYHLHVTHSRLPWMSYKCTRKRWRDFGHWRRKKVWIPSLWIQLQILENYHQQVHCILAQLTGMHAHKSVWYSTNLNTLSLHPGRKEPRVERIRVTSKLWATAVPVQLSTFYPLHSLIVTECVDIHYGTVQMHDKHQGQA